ncbi:MAG TPA: hypothetical protein VMC42_00775 [Methanoregulaceae archaeon]|nr:hypothetical protein [Methanoregulaceae archaeon]
MMYTREASALDLFTDSVRIMGDATLCSVMEFERSLDPVSLGEAVQACLLAHPILHSRLVRHNGPAHWEMVEPAGACPVPVTDTPEDYYRYVIGPVNPYESPQFRVRLLRRPSGDVIVINLAHAAADAFGLHALTSQLLQEFGDPGSIPPAEGGIPERDTLWTRMLFNGESRMPSGMKVINPMWPAPFGPSKKSSSYHLTSLGPSALDAVHRGVRTFGGSINDALLAAYYLAMSDLTGYLEPIALFFPVNIRQHLNDGSRVMSNQATNVCITLSRRNGEGMEEILPRVIGQVADLKAGYIGIAEQVEMDRNCDPAGKNIHQMVAEMAALQKTGLADIFISNPGPVTLPGADGLTDAYVCYPGGYMPTTCFITSTFRGKMTITMGYQDSIRARLGTQKAMHLFRQHLISIGE